MIKKLSQKLAIAAVVAMPLTFTEVPQASAQQSGPYGAIAYSPSTGRSGYSWNYPSRVGAQNRAVRECGVGDCRSVVWFSNACGTLARSSYGWGWAWAEQGYRSQNSALNACSRYGPGCRVVRTVCSPR